MDSDSYCVYQRAPTEPALQLQEFSQLCSSQSQLSTKNQRRRAVCQERKAPAPPDETPYEKSIREYEQKERNLFKEMRDRHARYMGDHCVFQLQNIGTSKSSLSSYHLLRAYRQLEPSLMLPIYWVEARYMPKIVAQIKMQQDIMAKIQAEEQAVGILRNLIFDEGSSAEAEYSLQGSNVYLEIYKQSESELDRLARKDKIPLLWRRDQLAELDYGRGATHAVYAVNNAYFSYEEPDGEEKVKKAWSKQFVAMQPDFGLDRCMRNSRLLSTHFISIFRTFFHNMKVEGFLKGLKDQRCHLFAFSLVWWEMYALFSPEQIKVDFFDLLCSRGGAIFQTYCSPQGLLQTDRKEFRNNFITKRHATSLLYCNEDISRAFKRFRGYYHTHPKEEGQVAKSDHVRHSKTFYDIWKSCVPQKFHHDRERCQMLADLMKFCLLTYSVHSFRQNQVDPEQRKTLSNKLYYRHTVQKQVKLFHGV